MHTPLPLLWPVIDEIAKMRWAYWKWEDEHIIPLLRANQIEMQTTGAITPTVIPAELAAEKQRMESDLGDRLARFAADARYYPFLAAWEIRIEGGDPNDPPPPPEVVQRILSSDQAFSDELMRRGESLAQVALQTVALAGVVPTSRTIGSTLWRFHVVCTEPYASSLCSLLLTRHRVALDSGLMRVGRWAAGFTVPHAGNRAEARQWLEFRNLPL